MADQLFQRLMPKEARFSRGESPTPAKLNGWARQIDSAFFILESFLGNGTDHYISNNSDRKMLFNISSAIGKTEKLYKPVNLIPALKRINNRFAPDSTVYNQETDTLTLIDENNEAVIPVYVPSGAEFGIFYKGRVQIYGLDGLNWTILPDHGNTYSWYIDSDLNNISKYIKLKKFDAVTPFEAKSIYIAEKINNVIVNKFYSLPLDNATYFSVKTPCKYSNPNNTNQAEICSNKSCNYCIGYTYNTDQSDINNYGSVKCPADTAIAQDGITVLNYTPDDNEIRKEYLTIQSPILTVSNEYSIKYKPMQISKFSEDEELPQNYNTIYDTKSAASAIKYNIRLFSTGNDSIIYTKSKNELSHGIGDNKRYIVLGGDYGMLDMLNDILFSVEMPLPHDLVGFAVYADEG